MTGSKILALAGVMTVSLAAATAGCGGESRSGEPPERQAAATSAAPAPTAPPAVGPGRPLRFRASDGVRLRGTVFAGAGRRSPTVVLVHQSDGGPDQFKPFLPYLHAAGYTALTYTSRPLPGRMDEAANARDIAGAVGALRRRPGVDRRRIAVVGASIGAAAAAHLSFTTVGRSLAAIIGLSPASFRDDPPRGRHPHDVLLISDERERINADFIADGSPGITVEVAPIAGHGVALLPDRRVRHDVLAWLRARLER
jgi:dienelactone hydrolase